MNSARMLAAAIVALAVIALWQLVAPSSGSEIRADDAPTSRPDDVASAEAIDSSDGGSPAAGGVEIEEPDPDLDPDDNPGAAAENAPTATEAERAAVAPFTIDESAA